MGLTLLNLDDLTRPWPKMAWLKNMETQEGGMGLYLQSRN